MLAAELGRQVATGFSMTEEMVDKTGDTRRELEEHTKRLNAARLSAARDVRARGRAQYVWRTGILRVGLPVALLGALILARVAPVRPPGLADGLPLVLGWAVLLVPIAVAAGTLFGMWMWRLYERHWFPRLDADQRVSPPMT